MDEFNTQNKSQDDSIVKNEKTWGEIIAKRSVDKKGKAPIKPPLDQPIVKNENTPHELSLQNINKKDETAANLLYLMKLANPRRFLDCEEKLQLLANRFYEPTELEKLWFYRGFMSSGKGGI